ncbi:MAG: ATP-dependent DNA helicase RecG [Verrucomicrobiota bacterium]
MLHSLDQRLEELKWFNARLRKAAAAFDYETVGGLLTHYPRRYEDRRKFEAVPGEPTEEAVCLHVEVIDTQQRFFGRRRMFEAKVQEANFGAMGGQLTLRWFNLPYIQKVIAVGQHLILFGKVKQSGKRLVMDHPEHEVIDPEAAPADASLHMGRITPVYSLKEGVAQRTLRSAIFRALDEVDPDTVLDLFPSEAAGIAGSEARIDALRQIHFPDNDTKMTAARRYLAFEEFFCLQIRVARSRAALRATPGASHSGPGELLRSLLDRLPFAPTAAQDRVIEEIRADLAAEFPMNRLLQGDVGSGKTFVALAAMLLAVESGCQAAVMAPTQILAEQHYLNFRKWLDPLGIRVSLRTGSKSEDSGDLPLFGGEAKAPQIIVGTHALLYDKSGFANLGLIVIDEQHKFGVAQRGRLQDRGVTPDVLVMTATPIPRTLTMTVYGDLDVSILDELPAGRGKIVTAIREAKKTPAAAKFVREQLDAGRQAYIVYPLIEESEKLKAKAVTTAFEEWKALLDPEPCAVLHGRLSPEEKEVAMTDFREGRTKVLIATTVIEVGVDVPNANLMLIYDAERFGLAQLHQLRGRIGRGAHKSYCVVMTAAKDDAARGKLEVFASTSDGFQIAEEDLKLRGPGDVLGTAQSGLGGLKLADFCAQADLVKMASDLAKLTVARDPELLLDVNAPLRHVMASNEGSRFAEVS